MTELHDGAAAFGPGQGSTPGALSSQEGPLGTCAFVTFGCKINFYDTQAVREQVLDLGYAEVPAADGADLLVVNSCTVTARAGEKSTSAVRRLARRNPGATIIVTGCMTEAERRDLAEIPRVLHVVGNEEKDQIPALLQGAERRVRRGRGGRDIFRLRTSRFAGRTRAFLKVHDGCDEFCSYCIIPLLRGRSKSRDCDEVVEEARRLADAGHRELVLTGIHLSRYGRDITPPTTLVELLAALVAVPGIERVRLSSIGEGAFTDEFLDLFATQPALCRFFHVPLQSGSDAVLTRMRRDYTVRQYLDAIGRIRERLDDALIATDLMIGFPGETDAEFEESLDTCRQAAFAKMHLFPYSLRPRTLAARLPGHLGPDVKDARMQVARGLEADLGRRALASRIGRTASVLVEGRRAGHYYGTCRAGYPVRFRATDAPDLWNHELRVRICAADADGLLGSLEPEGASRSATEGALE
ncbi:MAG: tRNA (N(6)-L-threonylcarbamoyladenosine(37)-C(2))-methylthiotransferase MtaB [Planctomycetota bacterium]